MKDCCSYCGHKFRKGVFKVARWNLTDRKAKFHGTCLKWLKAHTLSIKDGKRKSKRVK